MSSFSVTRVISEELAQQIDCAACDHPCVIIRTRLAVFDRSTLAVKIGALEQVRSSRYARADTLKRVSDTLILTRS